MIIKNAKAFGNFYDIEIKLETETNCSVKVSSNSTGNIFYSGTTFERLLKTFEIDELELGKIKEVDNVV